jgi:hypothetical protein
VITLFSVEGLSAEAHTEIRRQLSERLESPVGALVPDRAGFGIIDETLITNVVSAVVATAALILQLRDRQKYKRGSPDSDDARQQALGASADLNKEEVEALERALDRDESHIHCRGLDFRLRVSKEVLEVRVTRSRGS